jgi:hypothetical protein
MVQVIGLMKRDFIMVVTHKITGQVLIIIICGDEIEIMIVMIMIMVIKVILDNDHVLSDIMYLVYENGLNYLDYL